ncbi:tannase [Lactobacillus nasalidis]|uniref:Tannase n=2 Tax=Lactobacillus nasalidis TaxID=2797258 RepID=A0ABQ3W4U9_9LACO|nr:subtype B tannase [Lactobacillus nasalidis]GHW00202.1 tannase [Lactobacillus nasalidis]GHW01563.1 tannase [Lactobacillus nasalidis]
MTDASEKLVFDPEKREFKKTEDGFEYCSWEGLDYVAKPADPIQKVNVFAPAAYAKGQKCGSYSRETAPIFMPNTVGGYMPGPCDYPGNKNFPTNSKTIVAALKRGYVVVSAGLRGRTLESGKAPAFIVDMKAAVRWVKYNSGRLPGNAQRIITNGTSAGGATSALTGASGNSSFFEKYLEEIGAAPGTDDIFAVSAYCPIHNLEHADAAYEWEFCGINDWHRTKIEGFKDGKPNFVPVSGELTAEEQTLSPQLKDQFIAYLNSLNLQDPETGEKLSLNPDGSGSFRDLVIKYLKASAQKALADKPELAKADYLTVKDGQVTDLDWDKYFHFITRMKAVPAFDDLDAKSPETDLFGEKGGKPRHFTSFSQEHSHVDTTLAPADLIAAVNPVAHLLSGQTDTPKYWRIRHGASDRDTSFAIPVILATLLANQGKEVDFALPWGIPHSGDYDLDELFDWIDRIAEKEG